MVDPRHGAPHLRIAIWQPGLPLIGFLNAASPDLFAHLVQAFRFGLNKTGDVEGQNATIEYRWAENKYDRLLALAAKRQRAKGGTGGCDQY